MVGYLRQIHLTLLASNPVDARVCVCVCVSVCVCGERGEGVELKLGCLSSGRTSLRGYGKVLVRLLDIQLHY